MHLWKMVYEGLCGSTNPIVKINSKGIIYCVCLHEDREKDTKANIPISHLLAYLFLFFHNLEP